MANMNVLTHDTTDGKEWTYRINDCANYFIFKEDVYPLYNKPAVYPNCPDRKMLPPKVESIFDLKFDDVSEAKSFFEAFDYYPHENEYVLYLDTTAHDNDEDMHHFHENFTEKVLPKETNDVPEMVTISKNFNTGKYVAIPCDHAVVYGDDDDKEEVVPMKVDPSTKVSVCDGVVAYKTEDHSKVILEGYEYDEITHNWTEIKTTRHIADAEHITRISDYKYFSTADYANMLLFFMQTGTAADKGTVGFEKYENINAVSDKNEAIDLVIYKANDIKYSVIIYREKPDDEYVTILEANIYDHVKDIKKMFL